jgi:hypothetical protein
VDSLDKLYEIKKFPFFRLCDNEASDEFYVKWHSSTFQKPRENRFSFQIATKGKKEAHCFSIFFLPHMEYEGSIGLLSRKKKLLIFTF